MGNLDKLISQRKEQHRLYDQAQRALIELRDASDEAANLTQRTAILMRMATALESIRALSEKIRGQ